MIIIAIAIIIIISIVVIMSNGYKVCVFIDDVVSSVMHSVVVDVVCYH